MLLYVVVHFSMLCSVLLEEYTAVYYSIGNGHLRCFHIVPVTNNDAVNILLKFFID